MARKVVLGAALAFFAFFPGRAELRAESLHRNGGGSEALRVSGRVLPAPGETTLPPVVWVILRASGARPYEGKQLLHRAGEFQFREVPQGNYILSVESEGYRTSTLELRDGSAVDGRRGLFIALGSRLADRSLTPGGPATIESETLKIPKKALREFQKASEQSGKSRLDRALEHLHQAIALHPDFFQAHNNLGTVYLRMRDYPEAEAAFLKAIEINPTSAMVYKNLGLTYIQTNRWESAVKMLCKATALDPLDSQAQTFLGHVLFRAGLYTGALVTLQRAVELDSDLPLASCWLGHTYLQLGRYPEAVSAFEDFLKSNQDVDASQIEKLIVKLQEAIKSGAKNSLLP